MTSGLNEGDTIAIVKVKTESTSTESSSSSGMGNGRHGGMMGGGSPPSGGGGPGGGPMVEGNSMTKLIELNEVYKIYQMGDNEVRAVDGINRKSTKVNSWPSWGNRAPGSPPA